MKFMSDSQPLLTAESITAGYGEGIVLHDVGFTLDAGQSLAVLGRNGVGKSTLMLSLLGHLPLRTGKIVMRGTDITATLPHERVGAGLGWVPQGRECFPSLTVDEHLVIAARKGPWNRDRVYELFPRLRERIKNMGNQLSGGEQQMLAIARALITNPQLLLLDEPMEGLAPIIVQELGEAIARLIAEGEMAVVLIEQHARVALRLTQKAVVIERGRIVHRADSATLLQDRALLERLLAIE